MPPTPICFKSRPTAQQQAENCCHDCPHQGPCFREGAADLMVRELMCALEFLRSVCEHAEGRKMVDQRRLQLAMRVGIRAGAKYRAAVPDYQMPSFWADVKRLPEVLGLPAGDQAEEAR